MQRNFRYGNDGRGGWSGSDRREVVPDSGEALHQYIKSEHMTQDFRSVIHESCWRIFHP